MKRPLLHFCATGPYLIFYRAAVWKTWATMCDSIFSSEPSFCMLLCLLGIYYLQFRKMNKGQFHMK